MPGQGCHSHRAFPVGDLVLCGAFLEGAPSRSHPLHACARAACKWPAGWGPPYVTSPVTGRCLAKHVHCSLEFPKPGGTQAKIREGNKAFSARRLKVDVETTHPLTNIDIIVVQATVRPLLKHPYILQKRLGLAFKLGFSRGRVRGDL